jgi:hypothetical protein
MVDTVRFAKEITIIYNSADYIIIAKALPHTTAKGLASPRFAFNTRIIVFG